MSAEGLVTCRCDELERPLWGFCDDDLFCSQCGRPVAQLLCPYLLPDDDPQAQVWIYPQKKVNVQGKQYVFPLTLEYADQFRQRQQRPPNVDFVHCRGPSTPWFESRLDRLPQDRTGNFHCRLIRKDQSPPAQTGPDELPLPPQGLENKIELVGDFGRREFLLRICNTPQVSVELEGPGIEKGGDARWEITLSEVLTADLTIRSTAPALITEDLDEIEVAEMDDEHASLTASVSVQLQQPLLAGTIIAPHRPWRSSLRLDTRNFAEPGRKCQLLIGVQTAIVRTPTLALELERVEKARLDFWPNPFTVDLMYVGELRGNAPARSLEADRFPPVIRKLRVSNIGEEAVRLSPPRVRLPESYPVENWLRVAWAGDVPAESRTAGTDGFLELEPGQQGEIEVTVDLRDFTPRSLPKDRTLRATIGTADQRGKPWDVEFRISDVQFREPATHPLAIDFGNSHSYAAIWNPGEPFPRQEMIVEAHDLRKPEAFPTAIFFEDLSDPAQPVYEIGHEAIERGRSMPHALVSDLKRWIGVPAKSRFREVRDAANKHICRLDIETLVQLYLRRLIHRSEAIIRRYQVTSIGVSYPSQFSPQRRQAFQEIILRMCRESSDSDSALRLVECDVDEANAVAIGFVFEQQALREELPQVVNDQHPWFVVASFDLGGGSLDTALLKFEVDEGDLLVPVYRSEYLGIGGNDRFGGDNMTVAYLELLKRRLRDKLVITGPGGQRLLDEIPLASEKNEVTKDRFLNFQALWTASEAIKLHQSRRARTAPTAEDKSALNETLRQQLVEGLSCPSGPYSEKIRALLQEGIDRDEFLVELSEAAAHTIECDLLGDSGYCVRDRIAESLQELCEFAARKRVEVDFIVLGGSGSRLPLVDELIREFMPAARIVSDPQRTKFRVAFGLARYLDVLRHGATSSHQLARSRDYTSADIGLVLPGVGEFLKIVPNCSPVADAGLWHPLQHGNRPLPVPRLIGQDRLLKFYRFDNTRHHQLLGWFDLNHPPTQGDASVEFAELPSRGAEVRLVGSESQLELRFQVDEQHCGTWRLHSV